MSDYLKEQKIIINSMINTYKEYEYNHYVFSIINKMLDLDIKVYENENFKCALKNNELYLQVNSEFKKNSKYRIKINLLIEINKELDKIIKEGEKL